MSMELLRNFQSLKMLWKLKEVNAWLYIRTNDIDKLEVVNGDLVWTNDEGQDRDLSLSLR